MTGRLGRDGSGPEHAQPRVAAIAAMLLAALALAAAHEAGVRLALASLLGGLAGFALYHASFGFASAWRRLLTTGRGAGVRAQLLLLGLVTAVSLPLLGYAPAAGLDVAGYVLPFGVGAAFGAFVFGVGMQLGGGCGSGTLYTVGGGSVRMTITLAAFVLGSLAGTAHAPSWDRLPRLAAISVLDVASPALAVALVAVVLSALAGLSAALERRRWGGLERRPGPYSALSGPWSLAAGAGALALVCILTLLVVGRPWGITAAFALWGAKLALLLAIPVDTWPYWAGEPALHDSLLRDPTSLMDFGIVLGALAASGLAGRFRPTLAISAKSALAAVIGGLLMGYGARLSYGCNIGAFLGGVTSGSLHGVGWLVIALAGTAAGVRLRPLFALEPPETPRGEAGATVRR